MKIVESTSSESIGAVSTKTALTVESALKTGEIKDTKHGLELNKNSEIANVLQTEIPIDFHNLIQYAAQEYRISNNPSDYVIVPVPIIITDTPNRNGVSFPAKEIAQFSPEHGMPYFKTWSGKPCFREHENKDPRKAKGIVLDTVMNKVRNYPGFYKIITLLAFDRTKDEELYNSIRQGNDNSYSMGAYVGVYRCSLCGALSHAKKATCSHIDPQRVNFYDVNGNLVYREALQAQGFEVSSVDVPAFPAAVSDFINVVDPLLR